MSSWRRLPYRRSLAGVAAGILAATLLSAECPDAVPQGGEGGEGGESGAATELDQGRAPGSDAPYSLKVRWLVPPDPSGDPPLAAPVALSVDESRGRLYVLETQPPELRVYDLRDGRYIGALGREGDGPGEYRRPIALAVGASGLVAVLSVSGRITYWAPNGALVGIEQAGPGIATDIVSAGADTFYVKTDIFPPDDVAEFRVATGDTVLGQPILRDSGIPGTEEPGRPFRNHAYAIAATAEGELLIAPPGPDYTIMRIGRTGQAVGSIRRPEITPLRRSEEEIEAVRERVRKAFSALGRAAPASLRVPLYRSHVARLAVGPDGSIWALTQRGDSRRVIIDRFSAAGAFTGSFVLELRASEVAVSSNAIYLLARSTLDVPGVAVSPGPDGSTSRRELDEPG